MSLVFLLPSCQLATLYWHNRCYSSIHCFLCFKIISFLNCVQRLLFKINTKKHLWCWIAPSLQANRQAQLFWCWIAPPLQANQQAQLFWCWIAPPLQANRQAQLFWCWIAPPLQANRQAQLFWCWMAPPLQANRQAQLSSSSVPSTSHQNCSTALRCFSKPNIYGKKLTAVNCC